MPKIDVNETTLHYRLDGPETAPVVMLSNSLASHLGMWQFQVPELVKAGFRVLRYDTRGHGESASPRGPYTIEMLADDAVGILDALHIQKVHFCGLSLGGMIAQTMGVRHENRLESLTLSSTSAYMGPPELWDERIEAVRNQGLQAVVDGNIERWFTADGRKHLGEIIKEVRGMILGTSNEGFIGCCLAIRDMDQRESIRRIEVPTQIIVGESDPGTPVESARSIHQRIPKSSLTVIEGAAHFVQMERPESFNRTLLDFLTSRAF